MKLAIGKKKIPNIQTSANSRTSGITFFRIRRCMPLPSLSVTVKRSLKFAGE